MARPRRGSGNAMPYLRREYVVPAEREEDVAAELWGGGTLGLEVKPEPDGRVRIEAYFEVGAPAVDLGAVAEETVPETDWFAAYREQARPFPVGRGFFVDPREPEEERVEAPEGRRLLRLPARGAFGIGSHESTRLAIELLEELPVAGKTVLDVGTGTGILAFVALEQGARRVVGYDNDPTAPFYARDNARLNGFEVGLFAGGAAALGERARFDLALANVVPEQILPDLPAIARRVKGGMVLSGILAERGEEMVRAAGGLGFVERARRVANEWVAFYVERER
jgi:ribosomal protein L11 methyltransferase